MRILLRAAYDGTAYHGWQAQPGVSTIEGEINKALSSVFEQDIQVTGGSRTDAGVHALCNVAVFDVDTRMEAGKIAYAVNTKLPEDIRIRSSRLVPPDFHPRKRESVKTYEYRIYRADFPMPVRRLYTFYTHRKIDVAAMGAASAYLEGTHDFKSFCSPHTQAETTVRTIHLLDVREEGPELVLIVSGNGFLYNMVRIIAGTLLDVGYGKYNAERVRDILDGLDRELAGPTLPACGLTLTGYRFVDFPAL